MQPLPPRRTHLALAAPLLPPHPTLPPKKAFTALAAKLKVSATAMSKNTLLMKQVMYYHFVTGSAGAKATYHTSQLKAGMKLDTMYNSTITRQPYQLTVASVTPVAGSSVPKIQIKSVGTSAYIYKPNIKCGAGVAHGIDNVLVPLPLSLIPRF
jgi:uncharacterized surface protein with fasciclin (FAS1) repeats